MLPIRPFLPAFRRPLAWVALGFAVGCSGPRDATPLPEPPLLDPSKIGSDTQTALFPVPIMVVGAPGAAPTGALVRATNLDSMDAIVASSARDDGSFELRVVGSPGNELRVDAVMPDTRRAAPVDFIATSMDLARSERFACVTVSPGFEVAFAAPDVQTITLANGCANALSVGAPDSRLGLTDFALNSTLPPSIAPGASAELAVRFAPSANSPPEDVLFLSLGDGSVTLRYPFTLYRP